jgi:outer membrane protein TolC
MLPAALAVHIVLASQLPHPAPLQPRPVLTPAEAVARALAHHPEAGAARAEQRRAESALAEAEAGLLPRVDFTGSVMQFQEPMVVTPIHRLDFQDLPEFDETLIQGDLRLEHTVYDGGVRRGAIAGRTARAEEAATGTAAVEQALVARTLTTYLQILGHQATLVAADRRIEAVEAERRRVEQLLAVGRSPEVDLRRAEAELAAARASRVRVATALDTAERDLGRLVGAEDGAVAAGTLTPIAAVVAEPPARETLYEALEESPAVVRARRALDAAEAAVAVAGGARGPRVAVVGDVKEYGSSRGDFDLEWNAGVQVAVPVFHGGELAERVIQAEAARDAAAERLRLARLDARAALDRALAALVEARARDEALAEAVKQYEEVVRIERLRLDTGVGVQADYLDAEAALLDARAGLVEARNAVVGARIEVARATGDLDLRWVEESFPEDER